MNELLENGQSSEPSINPTEEHANGLRAFAILGKFLQEDEWYPQELEGKNVYRMFFHGKNGELRCYAQVRVKLEQFIFYAIAPIRVPEEMYPAAAEFLTRANYGLRIGNFEMDYNDGEVRCKCSLDFEGELLSPNLIKHALYPAVHTMDRYLPGLLSVIYGGKTATEAIQEIESSNL